MHRLQVPSTTEPLDLRDLTDAIAKAHPDVPRIAIEAEVSEAAHAFHDAKVLDFLPVLIERVVKQRLRGATVAA
jgi:hypothetical protein